MRLFATPAFGCKIEPTLQLCVTNWRPILPFYILYFFSRLLNEIFGLKLKKIFRKLYTYFMSILRCRYKTAIADVDEKTAA